jgi:hypothetical protein
VIFSYPLVFLAAQKRKERKGRVMFGSTASSDNIAFEKMHLRHAAYDCCSSVNFSSVSQDDEFLAF